MTYTPTIVDVLENALDGDLTAERAEQLDLSEIEELRAVVLEFYESWVPRPPGDDVFRVHLGGWVASAADDGIARDLLQAATLYAHEVVVYDPVAAYFEPRRMLLRSFRPVEGLGISSQASAVHIETTDGFQVEPGNADRHRSSLAIAIPQIRTLAPLIRAGVLLPVPHLKLALQRQVKIWTAVRHLLADEEYLALVDQPVDRPALTWDNGIRPQILTHPKSRADALIQQYGDAAYYLSRSIAVADAAYASYVPPSATEWAIYEQRLTRLREVLGRRQRVDLTVAPALSLSKLPYFRGLSDSDILGARDSEESFAHWRASLRMATRQIGSLPMAGDNFVDEAREVLSDALGQAADEVRLATSRSATLKRKIRPYGLTMAAGAAGAAGEAALGGGSTAFAATGISGMLGWLADSLFPPSLSGSNAVMAHLVHDTSAEKTQDEDWPKREGLLITPKAKPGHQGIGSL